MKTAILARSRAKETALFILGIAVAASMAFTLATPQAHAAALTEPQIQAILNLLMAFDVPAAEIANVEEILHQSK